MTLKTLKDCYMSDGRNFEQRVREESIKWVKEFDKKWEDMNGFTDFGGELNSWIKHFFNIEESDLS